MGGAELALQGEGRVFGRDGLAEEFLGGFLAVGLALAFLSPGEQAGAEQEMAFHIAGLVADGGAQHLFRFLIFAFPQKSSAQNEAKLAVGRLGDELAQKSHGLLVSALALQFLKWGDAPLSIRPQRHHSFFERIGPHVINGHLRCPFLKGAGQLRFDQRGQENGRPLLDERDLGEGASSARARPRGRPGQGT